MSSWILRVAAFCLLLWILAASCSSFLGLTPNQVDLAAILAPPGQETLLGNDDLGRSVFERLVAGARTSLVVGFGVVAMSTSFGTLIGAVSGFVGGWFETFMARVIDLFLAFPGMLLAIALAGVMGPGLDNVILALVAVGWVGYARLARAQVLTLAQRDHVIAARALGSRGWVILSRHLIPLALAPLLVEATFGVAAAIIAEASLSFLGLGVQPPEASWGNMVRDGGAYLLVAPHLVLAPGLALLLVVLSINLLGDALRDRLDARTRGD